MNTNILIKKIFFFRFFKFLKIFSFFCFLVFSVFCIGSSESSFSARGINDIISTGGGFLEEPNLPTLTTTNTPEDKVNHIIYSVIEVILALCGLVAVIFIVIGGARYTMSAGDDDMINGAKSMILYALAGLLVIIFSYAILSNLIDAFEIAEVNKG